MALVPDGRASEAARTDSLAPVEIERTLAAGAMEHQPFVADGRTAFRSGATVDAHGARLPVPHGSVTVGLAAVGRRDAMRATEARGAGAIVGPEVRIERAPGVVEWWRSLPSGLEQGVTLAERPAGDGPLLLEMTTGGSVSATLEGDAIALRSRANGEVVARYSDLVVRDAAGRRVDARLAAAGNRIRIEVADRGARYPLVVDPLLFAVEEAVLLSADTVAFDRLGSSVGLSADGLRAIVGAPLDNTARGADCGSARIFVRSGTTWTQEATLLTADAALEDGLGYGVALDADGDTAVVGAPLDDTAVGTDVGSVRVFTRSGSTWSERATLSPPDGGTLDWFGFHVAVSGDGTHILVGAHDADAAGGTDAGNARIYAGSGSAWAQEAVLVASDGAATDGFGWSVALDGAGDRALVGVLRDDLPGLANAGSARVFRRSGTLWTQETMLVAPDAAANDALGGAVSLSADGVRALVGAAGDEPSSGPPTETGSARVFVRTGSSWAQEAALWGAPRTNANLGSTAALSADGTRAVLGEYPDLAHVFVRSGTAWGDGGEIVTTGSPLGGFGQSVAIDGTGDRALIGAPTDNTRATQAGTARVFTFVPGLPNGSPCGPSETACLSGLCAEGVCCDARCDTPCAACTAARTGLPDGTCAPLSAAVAPTVSCRSPDLGDCDAEEFCTSTSLDCPPDGFLPSSAVCRPSASACDVPERCTGALPDCPGDSAASAGTVCRGSTGACDPSEICDGSSLACPGDLRAASGVVCRSAAGSCDVEERCDGASVECPLDAVVSSGTCRPAAGPCDVLEACTGASSACPADAFLPSSTVCNGLVMDVCDAPDLCSGATAACPPTFLVGVECRPPGGACDAAEVCVGDSASCPTDAFQPAGMTCRTASAACDPQEACDGVSASCPRDVSACGDGGGGDGGPTPADGGARDAGEALDSSTPDAGAVAAVAGCTCGVASRARGPSPVIALGAVLGVLRVARRRVARRSNAGARP